MSAFRFELTAKMCRMTIIKSWTQKLISDEQEEITVWAHSTRENCIRRAILAESQRGEHKRFPEGFKLFSHASEGKGKVGNQLPNL